MLLIFKKLNFQIVLFFILLLTSNVGFSKTVNEINNNVNSISIKNGIELLAPEKNISLDEASDSDLWKEHNKFSPVLYSSEPVFYKIPVTKKDHVRQWQLFIKNSSLRNVQIMVVNQDGNPIFKTPNEPDMAQNFVNGGFVFLIPLESGKNNIIVKASSPNNLVANFKISRHIDKNFIDKKLLFEGLAIGFIFSLFFYNLFLYMKTKHINHFYYCILQAPLILFYLSFSGIGHYYLWSGNEWMLYHSKLLFMGLFVTSAHFFSLMFLNVRKNLPSIFSPLMSLTLFWAGWTVFTTFVDEEKMLFVSFIILPLSLSIGFMLGITLWSKNYVEAKYYTIASGSFIFCFILEEISFLIDYQFLYIFENSITVGLILYSLIMSMALVELINKIKQESDNKTRHVELAKAEAQAKGDFLASMSHEIRTPMNGVLGMAEILKETQLTEEQEEYLDSIQSSGNSLLNVINDILHFSKIESGKIEINVEDFYIEELIDDVISMFRANYFKTKVPLYFEIDGNVPDIVRGDPERLKQILMNLIGNAYKFTQKGQIVIKVSFVEQTSIYQYKIKFEVIDTGIGLSQEKQDILFQPFSQADKNVSRQYGGTGLGLAISKRLSETMGGEIGVISNEGAGSNFWFTTTLEEGISSEVNYWYDLDEIKRHTIALVTDNVALENSFRSLLVRHKISFMSATTKNSLNEIDRPCDLIFSDSMDSFDIPEKIVNKKGNAPKFVKICDKYSKNKNELKIERVFTADKLMVTILKAFNEHSINTPVEDKRQSTLEEDSSESVQNVKVLIAEDNTVNQKVIVKRMKNFGITPYVVENGEEVVSEYISNHNQYDLILMDCEMPILSGYEATQKIRDFEKRKHLRPAYIVALSANALEEQRHQGITSGMDDYLTKPANKEKMLEILKRVKRINL